MNTPTDTPSGGIRAELGEDAAHLGESLKGRAAQKAETGKDAALGIAGSASGALGAAADDLRDNPDAPEWMAKGLQQVARQIDRVAGDLQGRSLEDMTREAARFARENPGTFLAAAAAAGFAAARLTTRTKVPSAIASTPRRRPRVTAGARRASARTTWRAARVTGPARPPATSRRSTATTRC